MMGGLRVVSSFGSMYEYPILLDSPIPSPVGYAYVTGTVVWHLGTDTGLHLSVSAGLRRGEVTYEQHIKQEATR